jgi:sugar transferase (PEP-CTERM/EpsH1 system associated)
MSLPNPLRILFVTPYKPDLIRVRPYQFIRHLARLGHKITLVYYDSAENAKSHEEMDTLCEEVFAFPITKFNIIRNCLLSLPTKKPIQAAYGMNSRMLNQLVEFLNNKKTPFDVVHFEHLRAVDFALSMKQSGSSRPVPFIWDSVDSITHLFRQASKQHPLWIGRKFLEMETRRTSRYEPKAASTFSQVLVTSQADQRAYEDLLWEQNLTANIQVLANGVDLEYFCMDPQQSREENTLVISGKMSYHANQKMVTRLVEEIMPLVWKHNPSVKLWIVGQNPSKEINGYGADPRITVTGWVSDIRPYLQKAAISVAPLAYGAGIQNKILEAMACGTPVIASATALNALQALPGQDLLSANDAQAFANSVIDLLSNPEKREAMGSAGRLYVENNHSWGKAAEKLTQVYQTAISLNNSLYS